MKSIMMAAIILIESLCAVEAIDADKIPILPKIEEQKGISYGYAKLSDQWIVFPGLGGGYRSHNMHGFDIDLTFYTYYDAGYSFYGKTHYLFYPTREHFYLGVGAGVIGGYFYVFHHGAPLINFSFGDGSFIKPTLEGVVGCEWKPGSTPIFLQLEVGGTYSACPLYPALSFGVGF